MINLPDFKCWPSNSNLSNRHCPCPAYVNEQDDWHCVTKTKMMSFPGISITHTKLCDTFCTKTLKDKIFNIGKGCFLELQHYGLAITSDFHYKFQNKLGQIS